MAEYKNNMIFLDIENEFKKEYEIIKEYSKASQIENLKERWEEQLRICNLGLDFYTDDTGYLQFVNTKFGLIGIGVGTPLSNGRVALICYSEHKESYTLQNKIGLTKESLEVKLSGKPWTPTSNTV